MSIAMVAQFVVSALFSGMSVVMIMGELPKKTSLKKIGVTYSHYALIRLVYWTSCISLAVPLGVIVLGFPFYIDLFSLLFVVSAVIVLILDAKAHLPKLNYESYLEKVVRPLPVFGAFVAFDMFRFGFRMVPSLAKFAEETFVVLWRLIF